MADSFTEAQDHFLDWVYARFRESGRWPTRAETEIALRDGPSPSRLTSELMPAFVTSGGSSPESTWQLTLRAITSRAGSEDDLDHFIDVVRLAAEVTIAAGGPVEVSSESLEQNLAIPRLEVSRVMEIVKREEFVDLFRTPASPERASFTPAGFAARFDGVGSLLDYWQVIALRENESRQAAEIHSANWKSRHNSAKPRVEDFPSQTPPLSGELALREKMDGILLEPEQVRTIELLVEASRSVQAVGRQPFRGVPRHVGPQEILLLLHPGIPTDHAGVYPGDIEQLAAEDLIRLDRAGKSLKFDVTPFGYRYYAHLKESSGESSGRVGDSVRSYLDSSSLRHRHPAAVAKWEEAEHLLWTDDSREPTTTIGHLCREAHQEFATSLLCRHPIADAPTDLARTKARVASVLADLSIVSGSIKAFVEALGNYWGAVVDLAMRQEHGGLKEGEPLTWEDSRRLVFATIFAMTEIDRLV